MDTERLHVRKQFGDALRSLIGDGVDALGEDEIADLLQEMLEELDRDGEHAAEVELLSDDGSSRLVLNYPTAASLEEDIETFLEVRGLTLQLDEAPELMEAIDVVVTGESTAAEVTLRGRAVHATDGEVVVELLRTDLDERGQLQELAEAIRTSSPPAVSDDASDTEAPAEPVDEPTEKPEEPSSDSAIAGSVPIVDRLVEQSEDPTRTWDLRDDSPEEFLLEIATTSGYAVLDVELDDEIRQFIVHDGKLIDGRVSPPVDTEQLLVERLVERGWVDSEQIERAEALANIHDTSRQDALVDIGAITVEQLLEVIRQRLVEELETLWNVETAHIELSPLTKRPALRLRRTNVDLLPLIADRIRERFERLSPEELTTQKSYFSGHRLKRRQDPPFDVERLDLEDQPQRLFDVVLEEPRSFEELTRMSNLFGDGLLRTLLVFDELNLLERCGQSRRVPEHDQIEGLAKGLAGKNHFDVLEVHWSTYGDAVEEAYRKMRDRLDVPEVVEQDLEEELQQLRDRVAEARSVLSNPKSRRAYRDEQIDDFAQRSALEVYERKAESYEMKRDLEQLEDCLARIVELNPADDQAKKKLEALRERS